MSSKFFAPSLIIGFSCLPLLTHAVAIDCDGYAVTDTATLDSAITAQLDSASDTGFVEFSISFWWPGAYVPPDSCSNMGVTCHIPPSTIDPYPFWEKWTSDLFGKYEMFAADVSGPSLSPGTEFSISGGYQPVKARKVDVLSMRKECYVQEIHSLPKNVTPAAIRRPSSKVGFRPLKNSRFFNAAGQRVSTPNRNNAFIAD